MSDLVQDLREGAESLPHEVYTWLHPLLTEAANEIERLRSLCVTMAGGNFLDAERAVNKEEL